MDSNYVKALAILSKFRCFTCLSLGICVFIYCANYLEFFPV